MTVIKRYNNKTFKVLGEPLHTAKMDKRGYKTICFNKKKFYEHRIIVAYHFGVDYLFSKQCVDHINGNKSDNRIENLRVLSIKENTLEAEKTGNFKRTYGEINGLCKINKKEIKEIKYLYKNGFKQKEIATLYKVSQPTISGIINNKTRVNG